MGGVLGTRGASRRAQQGMENASRTAHDGMVAAADRLSAAHREAGGEVAEAASRELREAATRLAAAHQEAAAQARIAFREAADRFAAAHREATREALEAFERAANQFAAAHERAAQGFGERAAERIALSFDQAVEAVRSMLPWMHAEARSLIHGAANQAMWSVILVVCAILMASLMQPLMNAFLQAELAGQTTVVLSLASYGQLLLADPQAWSAILLTVGRTGFAVWVIATITQLRRETRAVNSRFQAVETRVTQLEQHDVALTGRVQAVETQVTQLEGRVQVVETQVRQLEGHVVALTGRVHSVEEQVTQLKLAMDTLSSLVTQIKADIAALRQKKYIHVIGRGDSGSNQIGCRERCQWHREVLHDIKHGESPRKLVELKQRNGRFEGIVIQKGASGRYLLRASVPGGYCVAFQARVRVLHANDREKQDPILGTSEVRAGRSEVVGVVDLAESDILEVEEMHDSASPGGAYGPAHGATFQTTHYVSVELLEL
mmetsp:Transcript_12581/g.23232  ORF Transcript_12581/g.23232 Transcript_12581/m.23232 type:complete len:493 (+) Transcript_12581:66-1544(+)